MHIAILTFDGFNELDSLIALGILNRIKQPGWRVSLAAPSETVTSMNGVKLHRQARGWMRSSHLTRCWPAAASRLARLSRTQT